MHIIISCDHRNVFSVMLNNCRGLHWHRGILICVQQHIYAHICSLTSLSVYRILIIIRLFAYVYTVVHCLHSLKHHRCAGLRWRRRQGGGRDRASLISRTRTLTSDTLLITLYATKNSHLSSTWHFQRVTAPEAEVYKNNVFTKNRTSWTRKNLFVEIWIG